MLPFFSIERSLKITLLSLAALRFEVMGWVAKLLSLLPAWLRIAIVAGLTRELCHASSD